MRGNDFLHLHHVFLMVVKELNTSWCVGRSASKITNLRLNLKLKIERDHWVSSAKDLNRWLKAHHHYWVSSTWGFNRFSFDSEHYGSWFNTEKSFMNLVKLYQIWIAITFFRWILHQTKFCLVPNRPEKCLSISFRSIK